MITPEAPNLRATRPDFEDLQPVMPIMELIATGIDGRLTVLKAPDEDVVVMLRLEEASVSDAPVVAKILESLPFLRDGAHVCIDAAEREPDFATALDEATGARFKITLVVPPELDAEIEAAVAGVKRPEGRPAAMIPIPISERDVDRMVRKGCAGKSKDDWLPSLVPADGEDPVGTHWRFLYWMGSHWLESMHAQAFFAHHGIPFQIAQDANDKEYAILTDFELPTMALWKEQRRLRERLEREKAVESGDDLEVAFLAQSPDDDC
jgi:hypothetical protein